MQKFLPMRKLGKLKSISDEIKLLEKKAHMTQSTAPLGQLPPIFYQYSEKETMARKKFNVEWLRVRNLLTLDKKKTLWQLAIDLGLQPPSFIGDKVGYFDLNDMLERIN